MHLFVKWAEALASERRFSRLCSGNEAASHGIDAELEQTWIPGKHLFYIPCRQIV